MKIAVIGAGVAGLVSAHLLSKQHDVSLFEAKDFLGGHTNTIPVDNGSGQVNVDTGFIVFNEPNYPNFRKFLSELNVDSQESDMSFSFYDPMRPFYYASMGFDGVFAQFRNVLNPCFYYFIWEIERFNRVAKEFLDSKDSHLKSMKDFIIQARFSDRLVTDYLLPMGAAIWSCSYEDILDFPAQSFIQFWKNHDMLTLAERPIWRTVKGGSFQYVKAFEKQFKGQVYKNNPVRSVRRFEDHVALVDASGQTQQFDKVVFATHGDLVLNILDDACEEEVSLFSNWKYSNNYTVLHTDVSVMPPTRKAWASWNYIFNSQDPSKVSVTYYMNCLQRLSEDTDYLVTLNPIQEIDPDKIIKTFDYTHPLYTFESIQTQDPIKQLSGAQNTYYCGSYLGYGFHEDAVKSAVDVAAHFGVGFDA